MDAQRNSLPQIAAGKSKIVNFKILAGLFSQEKYINLKFVPISLEFELCDQNDAIITPHTYTANSGYQDVYTTANTTNLWQIQNCQIKCSIAMLDSQLQESYTQHLLSGKSFFIEYSTFISQQSSVAGK